jgi:hypothetical protein
MRVRYLGSYDGAATAYDSSLPIRALLPMPGTVSDPLPAVDFLYPIEATPDQICEIVYRIQYWKYVYSWNIGWTDAPGITANQAGTATTYHASPALDERELITTDPGNFPSPIVDVFTSEYDFTTTYTGGPLPDHQTSNNGTGSLSLLDELSGFDGYYYDPTLGLYLPRIFFTVSPNASVIIEATNSDETGGGAYNGTDEPKAVAETCVFLGSNAPMTLIYGFAGTDVRNNSMALNSWSLTISGHIWWAYSGGSGAIWNTTTGALLQDNKTLDN